MPGSVSSRRFALARVDALLVELRGPPAAVPVVARPHQPLRRRSDLSFFLPFQRSS